MKQETKELLTWIENSLNTYVTIPGLSAAFPILREKCDKALAFLNSLPEIESHLCRGGYIQDKNGTPCCDGDKVIIVDQFLVGVLRWDVHDKKFVVTDDTDHSWTLGNWEFKKVE